MSGCIEKKRWRLSRLICEQKSARQECSQRQEEATEVTELPPAFHHIPTLSLSLFFISSYFNISFSAYSRQHNMHTRKTLPVPLIRQMTGEDSPRCQTRHKGNYWLLLLLLHSVSSFHLKTVQEEELECCCSILSSTMKHSVCVCVWRSIRGNSFAAPSLYTLARKLVSPRRDESEAIFTLFFAPFDGGLSLKRGQGSAPSGATSSIYSGVNLAPLGNPPHWRPTTEVEKVAPTSRHLKIAHAQRWNVSRMKMFTFIVVGEIKYIAVVFFSGPSVQRSRAENG